MNVRWAMCHVAKVNLWFFYPGRSMIEISIKDYLRSKGVSSGWSTLPQDTFPFLLQDGWEPFDIDTYNNYTFKMKVTIDPSQ